MSRTLCYLKRKAKCAECGEEIVVGQPVLKSKDWIQAESRGFLKQRCFHWECFKRKGDRWFEEHPFVRQGRRKRKKGRGRPALPDAVVLVTLEDGSSYPVSYRKERRRLQDLCRHHRSAGNKDREEELLERIRHLETTLPVS